MDAFKEYWRQWLWRDAVTRLITVNFLTWLACAAASMFGLNIARYFVLPASWDMLAMQPWSVLSYTFVHYDFLHMFVNMMWLLLFGQLFMQAQGGTRLIILYLLGGIAGAAAFMLYHVHPSLLGASGAVFAIIGASMILYPKWEVNLLIFGPVKVMWISVTAIVLFMVIGGGRDIMVVHVAGLAVGILYAFLKKRGTDITRPISKVAQTVKSKRRHYVTPHVSYGGSRREEAELDALLEKVGRRGYESLSPSERQRLFDLSRKINR